MATWDDVARLALALPERRILEGPLLTVAGTLLQNRAMLQFYRRVWALLAREGWRANRKRVYRLWRTIGLRVPQRSAGIPLSSFPLCALSGTG